MCILFLCSSCSFFKCSVSCGIGIQVRKIDCILPAILNASNAQITDGNHNNGNGHQSASIGSAGDDDAITSLSNEPNSDSFIDNMDESMLQNEPISMDCDPRLKPIETQTCTTGIECMTTTTTTTTTTTMEPTTPNDFIVTNNDNNHEDNDKIASASNENGMEKETENINLEIENNERSELNSNSHPFEISVEENIESTEVDDNNNNNNQYAQHSVSADDSAAMDSEEFEYGNEVFQSIVKFSFNISFYFWLVFCLICWYS